MSLADHHGKGQEPLPNCKQLLDTDMRRIEGRIELTGDINATKVCAPAQRRSIGIQNHNLRQSNKAKCRLSDRQGSPPMKLLNRSFIEAYPATRVLVML